MADAAPPLLLFVVGPPAVGKMSVGQAIAERTGLRLFHNHIAIELALRYFDYGTPAFHRIDGAIRRLVIEEVAASDLPGLVFTYVWAFNVPADQALVEEYAKPSRRDLEASRRNLLETDARYQLNSGGKFDARPDYLRINNTLLTPGEVAERVIEHFALPRFTGANPACCTTSR